jgi:hypothetical protein
MCRPHAARFFCRTQTWLQVSSESCLATLCWDQWILSARTTRFRCSATELSPSKWAVVLDWLLGFGVSLDFRASAILFVNLSCSAMTYRYLKRDCLSGGLRAIPLICSSCSRTRRLWHQARRRRVPERPRSIARKSGRRTRKSPKLIRLHVLGCSLSQISKRTNCKSYPGRCRTWATDRLATCFSQRSCVLRWWWVAIRFRPRGSPRCPRFPLFLC